MSWHIQLPATGIRVHYSSGLRQVLRKLTVHVSESWPFSVTQGSHPLLHTHTHTYTQGDKKESWRGPLVGVTSRSIVSPTNIWNDLDESDQCKKYSWLRKGLLLLGMGDGTVWAQFPYYMSGISTHTHIPIYIIIKLFFNVIFDKAMEIKIKTNCLTLYSKLLI